jgi:hypothetical protein
MASGSGLMKPRTYYRYFRLNYENFQLSLNSSTFGIFCLHNQKCSPLPELRGKPDLKAGLAFSSTNYFSLNSPNLWEG